MDRTTTSKVKRGKVEKPTIAIPGPASDGAVDDGSPAKGKDHGRHDATTLKRTSNHKLNGNGTEEHLVETEDNLWNQSRTGRRCDANVHQAKVGHVANKGTGSARVRQTVAPKHPLEAYTIIY